MLIGFAAGLVAGAAIAILWAPAPGTRTRRWVADQGRAAGRRAARLFDRETAISLIRREGIIGLAARLRRTPASPPAGGDES